MKGKAMEKVFVYGTLKKGGGLSLTRMEGARLIGEAQVQGELRQHSIPYFLPWGARPEPVKKSEGRLRSWYYDRDDSKIPELLPHAFKVQPWDDAPEVPMVHGELWEVPANKLYALDAIEGSRRDDLGSSHYIPVKVLVMMDDEQTLHEATAYSFNVLEGSGSWESLDACPDGMYQSYRDWDVAAY